MKVCRILIADRDPHTHTRVCHALKELRLPRYVDAVDFRVERAATSEEAIQRIARNAPHIVVLEHHAPGLDSCAILRTLKRDYPHTTAIVAATRPSIPAAVQAIQLGAAEFLAKPLSAPQFREILADAVTHHMRDLAHSDCPPARSPARTLMRIPAALARLATTAVSLHY